jgi:excisionase family DNA binding protein
MLNDRILTITDVATLLKIPKSSVYKLIHESGLPAHRVGKHFRLVQGEVKAWLQKESMNHEEKKESLIHA